MKNIRTERGGGRKREMMENLSDSLLIESYEKARKYHLSAAFIELIKQEMKRRRIQVPEHQLN